MNINTVKKCKMPITRLMYWIVEREKVRLAKEAGLQKPWTDDEILQRYRFCNVRRMDDKVSRWLLDNWYVPHYDHKNILLAVALARFVNLPTSLKEVGFPTRWNPTLVKRRLRYIRDEYMCPVFNGAYMVRGNDGMDKIECVVDYYVQPLRDKPPELSPTSMRGTHAALRECYGFGSFMAGQVVADLRWAMAGYWSDRWTWAPIGPGSQRGMNRLLSRPLKAPMTQNEFEEQLNLLIELLQRKLPTDYTVRLEAMDYQNCLCEFDTYERVLWGQGRKKQLYPGVE